MHWTRQVSASGLVNRLTAPKVDPVSGQPALKRNAVSVRKWAAAWYGFAASAHAIDPKADYAAIAKSRTGWQGEFGGLERPDDWEHFARDLLDQPGAAVSTMVDPASGQTRLAFYADGMLTGLFFVGPAPVVLARSFLVSLISTATPPLHALAGRSGADQPDPGATVCACMNVGINTLRGAVAAGAQSVEALGIATCAGTNCGACKPELERLLAQPPLQVAAE